MAIEKYMVEFTILDEIELPGNFLGADKSVIENILGYFTDPEKYQRVQDEGYQLDHGEEIDNHCDDQPIIGQTETYVTIRFQEEEDAIIWESEDLGTLKSLIELALKHAKNPEAHISGSWSCGESPLVRNTIEITTYER